MLEKKVTAAAIAGAVVTIVVWILNITANVTMPPEVAAAITTLLMATASYLAPHTPSPAPPAAPQNPPAVKNPPAAPQNPPAVKNPPAAARNPTPPTT